MNSGSKNVWLKKITSPNCLCAVNGPTLMTTPVMTRKRRDQAVTSAVYVTLGRKNDWTEIWLFRFDFDTSEQQASFSELSTAVKLFNSRNVVMNKHDIRLFGEFLSHDGRRFTSCQLMEIRNSFFDSFSLSAFQLFVSWQSTYLSDNLRPGVKQPVCCCIETFWWL